jgi:hypothetical protein
MTVQLLRLLGAILNLEAGEEIYSHRRYLGHCLLNAPCRDAVNGDPLVRQLGGVRLLSTSEYVV